MNLIQRYLQFDEIFMDSLCLLLLYLFILFIIYHLLSFLFY